MGDVRLASAEFGNIDPQGLARGFLAFGQPAVAQTDAVILSPRTTTTPWLEFKELVSNGFDKETFTKRFLEVDNRVDPSAQLGLENRLDGKAAVKNWLDEGRFGQLAAKLLNPKHGPNMRHLFLREIVLPVFFEKYPKGIVGCVTYHEGANSYLALLNTLKKAQILNTNDPKTIQAYAGKSAMSSFALNVPAELIGLMLSFSSAVFFPDAYAFVASCEHLYFLIFITDAPVNVSQGEERYPPLVDLIPNLASVLDDKENVTGLLLSETFVAPNRRHPFNRRTYRAIEVIDLLKAYVGNIDRLLQWLCEATNFATATGDFDIDFAFQAYLTLYVLLHTTYRITMEQADMFSRKMWFFDLLELYAGLVDCSSPAAQAQAWKAHLEGPFVHRVLSALSSYPDPFAKDFADGMAQLRSENQASMERGLIFGRHADGT